MIQRLQSVYLSLLTLLSLLLFKGSILAFYDNAGIIMKITCRGIVQSAVGQSGTPPEKLFLLSAIVAIIPVLALVTIFFFRKRAIQLWLSKILIGVLIAFLLILAFYSYHIISSYGSHLIPGVKMSIPVLLLILAVLAHRGIRKDDQLVKSYDRLR
jgi:di/tricarboxylate transporter